MTPPVKRGTSPGDPYVVCLDCGKQFTYDWKNMRVGRRVGAPPVEAKNWFARLLQR